MTAAEHARDWTAQERAAYLAEQFALEQEALDEMRASRWPLVLTAEPHCGGCGAVALGIDGYCGACHQGEAPVGLRHCPGCGYDVAALVDRTLAARAWAASKSAGAAMLEPRRVRLVEQRADAEMHRRRAAQGMGAS